MGLGMFPMDNLNGAEANPIAVVSALQPEDVPRFLRKSIREKKLTLIVQSLNKEVLSRDPRRRDAAQDALRRIGFI